MGRTMKVLLAVLAGGVVVAVVLFASGTAQRWLLEYFVSQNAPEHEFDPGAPLAEAPDYANPASWAALPDKRDPADLVPEGVEAGHRQGDAPVDVFFVHPTGYLSGASWTSPMDPDSAAEENTEWMMAYQASAYNGCCNVYAPRYREATIHAYFQDEPIRDRILGFAYADVERAFDHFLEHFSRGPFVLASHSQGTHHMRRLLRERIDGTPLYDRMVAAFAIGSVNIEWSESYFDSMKDVRPCLGPTETGCVVHWDTFSESGDGLERTEDSLCTNPLTWLVNEERAPAAENAGAVPVSIPYNIDFSKGNEPRGVEFTELRAPIPNHTWAQCRDGTLFVADQSGGPFAASALADNYHGLDYALFYMDIRQNAIDRVDTYLARSR